LPAEYAPDDLRCPTVPLDRQIPSDVADPYGTESATRTVPLAESWSEPAVEQPQEDNSHSLLTAIEAAEDAISVELQVDAPDEAALDHDQSPSLTPREDAGLTPPEDAGPPVPVLDCIPPTFEPADEQVHPPLHPPRLRPELTPKRTSREDLKELCERIQSQLTPGIPASLLLTCTEAASATAVTIQLAKALAGGGAQVLSIDARLRGGDLSRILDADRVPGLTEILAHGRQRRDLVIKTPFPGAYLLPAGLDRKLAWEPTAEARFASMLVDFKQVYDFVLIDAADVFASEVCGLSRCCDLSCLVVRLHDTSRWDAIAAARRLQTSGGRIGGAILMRG
jgi:Mrp family chromosome partitioning ATPase